MHFCPVKFGLNRRNQDVSVELHMIEVLWCLAADPLMEEELWECCLGDHMDDAAKKLCAKPV